MRHMVNGHASGLLRQIVRVFHAGTFAGLPDGEILGRFVDDRDEAAFEVLLVRHGPMVLNVCRQILRHPDDAEDAFQATFLALACKAGTLRIGESLGPWLYRVSSRIAARARADRRRRRDRERSEGPIPEPEPARRDGADHAEMPRVIHEELGRLPDAGSWAPDRPVLPGRDDPRAGREPARLSGRHRPQSPGPRPGPAWRADRTSRTRRDECNPSASCW